MIDLSRAALDVSPRMLFDPRAQVSYVSTLTSKFMRFQESVREASDTEADDAPAPNAERMFDR